ncbi:hypothetical protein ACLOJK_014543 [Asimina triloba]
MAGTAPNHHGSEHHRPIESIKVGSGSPERILIQQHVFHGTLKSNLHQRGQQPIGIHPNHSCPGPAPHAQVDHQQPFALIPIDSNPIWAEYPSSRAATGEAAPNCPFHLHRPDYRNPNSVEQK